MSDELIKQLMPDWVKDIPKGLCATMYGTGSYEGDLEVKEKVDDYFNKKDELNDLLTELAKTGSIGFNKLQCADEWCVIYDYRKPISEKIEFMGFCAVETAHSIEARGKDALEAVKNLKEKLKDE
jgi:hypothetical protein